MVMNNIVKEDLANIVSAEYIDWSRFTNKTVLITGANGMLPSYMVETLLYLNETTGSNIKVIALVRNRQKALDVFGERENLDLLVQDVCEDIHIERGLNFIIHAASQASPSFYGTDPVGTLKANVLGTYNLLELARKKNVESFLYFSSGTIYGTIAKGSTYKEDEYGLVDPLKVRSCYAESKKMGETMCVSYSYQYGIKTKMIRIFHTFGPNIQLNDGRAFSDFCKSIVEHNDIVLHSDGRATRPFCYVSDAIKAYFKILLDGETASAYNVGGDKDHEISMKDLAELLVNLYPERGLKVVFDIDSNNVTYGKMKAPQESFLADLSKVKNLGWEQTISLRDSFKRTIEAIEIKSYGNR